MAVGIECPLQVAQDYLGVHHARLPKVIAARAVRAAVEMINAPHLVCLEPLIIVSENI